MTMTMRMTTRHDVLARRRLRRVADRRKMPEPADSGLYVYGIVPSTGAIVPDDVHGMDGHGVELVTHGELGALVTKISLPRPPGRRRDLLSHSDVLNAVAQGLDV